MKIARSFVCGAMGLAALALAPAAALAQASTWTLDSAKLYYNDSDNWVEYGNVGVTAGSTSITNGVSYFGAGVDGTLFDLPREQYQGTGRTFDGAANMLQFSGTATLGFSSWFSNQINLPTSTGFGFSFQSGSFTLTNIESGFEIFDVDGNSLAGVGSGSGSTPIWGPLDPAGYGFGTGYVDNFGNDPTNVATIQWTVSILFSWDAGATGDSLHFSMDPSEPSYVQIGVVPSVGSLPIIGLGGFLAASRRRR